jgi:hypothetical protein
MKQYKICASCQHENEMDVVECTHCGLPFQFDVRTPVISIEFQTDPSAQAAELVYKKPPPNIIALQVVNETNPVLVPYEDYQRLMLGRDMPEGDFHAVDLSDYSAQVLGVSRQHAVIHVMEDGCTIEDLNSTNGTWLNETRLAPGQPHSLQSGDLIRLGHLMIFISFRD